MLKCFDFLFVQLMYLGPVPPFKIYLSIYLLMYVCTLIICMNLPVCHCVQWSEEPGWVCLCVTVCVQWPEKSAWVCPCVTLCVQWSEEVYRCCFFLLSYGCRIWSSRCQLPSSSSLIPVLALRLEAIQFSSLSRFYNSLDRLLGVFPWAIVFQGQENAFWMLRKPSMLLQANMHP